MKTLYRNIFVALLLGLFACNTDVENIGYKPEHIVDYEAIKAYKKTDHELMFGWFGGWSGPGASMSASLMSLPDSVDMVSNWGAPWPLTDEKIADMKNVQQTKGTKVLACIFTPYLGRYITPEGEDPLEYWKWGTTDEEHMAAIKEYGHAMAKEVLKWGYDGLDIDNEIEQSGKPAHFFNDITRFSAFIEALGEYLGPKSGTDKILAVDGHLTTGLKPEMDQYLNYFISQAYYNSGVSNLDSRFNTVASHFSGTREELAKKFIATEDFEKHWTDGGPNFKQRDGSYTRSSLGMAAWKPLSTEGEELPKGGAGLYHIENEYRNTKMYYFYTRKMTQIMNPAKSE